MVVINRSWYPIIIVSVCLAIIIYYEYSSAVSRSKDFNKYLTNSVNNIVTEKEQKLLHKQQTELQRMQIEIKQLREIGEKNAKQD